MKVSAFCSCARISLFAACCLFSGSASARNSPTPAASFVVHVQELAMPGKVARAFEKGTGLLLKHQCEPSVAYFQKAIKLAPNLFPAYHNLGLAQYNLGHLDDAAQSFEKAIELSKGSFAPSFFSLGMIFYDRGEFVEAQRMVERGLLTDPSSAIGKYCLGLTQYALGRTADAQRSILEALRIDASTADAYLLLAHIHERLQDPNAVVTDVDAYFKYTCNNDLRADAVGLRERAERNLPRVALE